MKKSFLHLLGLVLTMSVSAQTITFDEFGYTNLQQLPIPYDIVNNGETFRFTISGNTNSTNHIYRTNENSCSNGAMSHLHAGNFSATTWTIETVSGNEIDLGSIRFDNVFSCFAFIYDLTIEGFKNNISTGTQTFSVAGMNSIFNSNASFNDVDKIVISCSDLANLGIDDINWVISPTLNVVSHTLKSNLKIFPNPVLNSITVEGLKSMEAYTVYNTLGIEVKKGLASNHDIIDVENLSNGIYFLRLNNKEVFRFVKK